jgi:hypothetical protein
VRVRDVNELPPQMRDQAQRELARFGFTGVEVPSAPKPSKYRNERVEIDGEVYDSKLEYSCHMALKRRKHLGEPIGLILRQVPFRLEGGVVYRADFVVSTSAGPDFVEVWDAKGKDTRSSINKRKQVRARYGIDVRLWTAEDRKAGR